MLNKENISGVSNAAIVQTLGMQFRTYRLRAQLTQKEVSERAGVSLLTLRAFEQGKATNLTMGNFLSLLRVLDQLAPIADILPDMPISPDAKQKAKRDLFFTLMANRKSTPITKEWVDALNTIDIAFQDNHKVRMAWREYYDSLNENS